MQYYEMLAVFPGTLSEMEVGPVAEALKETVVSSGGAEIAVHDLGKSRLAYPMRHIRYGYYRMYEFQAEPVAIPSMQKKVQLINHVLRGAIKKYDPKKRSHKLPVFSEIALDTIEEPKKEQPPVVEAIQAQFLSPAAPIKPIEEAQRKTEAIDLEDIDKKLDELLASDLSKV